MLLPPLHTSRSQQTKSFQWLSIGSVKERRREEFAVNQDERGALQREGIWLEVELHGPVHIDNKTRYQANKFRGAE